MVRMLLAAMMLVSALYPVKTSAGQVDDHTVIKNLIDRFFAAYVKKDYAGFIASWSPRSPDLAMRKQMTQQLFATVEKIELSSLAVMELKVEGDGSSSNPRAYVRLKIEMNGVEVQTGQASPAFGKMARVLHLVKEGGEWKIWRYLPFEQELAEALIAANGLEHQTRLLEANKEFINEELAKALLSQVAAFIDGNKFQDAAGLLPVAFKISEQLNTQSFIGLCHLFQGHIHARGPQADSAAESYRRALASFRASGEKRFEKTALYFLGVTLGLMERHQQAIEYFNEWLEVDRAVEPNIKTKASVLLMKGLCYETLADRERAIENLEQAQRIAHEIKHPSVEIQALDSLVLHYKDLKQNDKAIQSYERIILLRQAANDSAKHVQALRDLGSLYAAIKQPEKAIACQYRLLTVFRETKDRANEADTLNRIGSACHQLGRHDEAIKAYEQAIAICKQEKNREGEEELLFYLGLVYLNVGRFEESLKSFNASLVIAREEKHRHLEGLILVQAGLACNNLGRFDEAGGHLELALTILREMKDRKSEGPALNHLGFRYLGLRQPDKARPHLEQALVIAREEKARDDEGDALFNLGNVFLQLSQYDKALEYSEQSLVIFVERNNRYRESNALVNIGLSHNGLGHYDKAKEAFEKAVALIGETGNKVTAGFVLLNLANAYYWSKQPEKAIEYYEKALVSVREAEDQQTEATILANLGDSHYALNRYDKAIELLEKALAICRQIKSQDDEKRVFYYLGNAYEALSKYDQAIDCYERARALAREQKDTHTEAGALSNLASIYDDLGKYEKGVESLEQAIAIFREAKNRPGEAFALANLGRVYGGLSRYDKTAAYYQQSLEIYRELNDQSGIATVTANLAVLFRNRGQYEKAIDHFNKVLVIFREQKDRRSESSLLDNLGYSYMGLGRYQKAIEYYEQAVAISREIKDRQHEGEALGDLGEVYIYLNNYPKAIRYAAQALAILREVKNRLNEGSALVLLGKAYAGQGRYEKAIAHHRQGLTTFRELKNRHGEAIALGGLAETYRRMGQYRQAIDFSEQALVIFRELKDTQREGMALNNLMRAARAEANPRLAIFYGKQAVNAFQQIRGSIQSLEKESQQSFLKSKEETYRELADLLISAGRLAEAQQVLSLLKEQEYSDFIRRDQPSSNRADLTEREMQLEKRYLEIADHVTALGKERGELLARLGKANSLSPAEQQRLAVLDKDIEAANYAFRKFLAQLADEFRKAKEPAERTANVREYRALMQDLRELGQGAAAIYTLVGPEKYRVILITPDVIKGAEYPIKAADLYRKVLAFRQTVEDIKTDPRPLAQELYKIMLAPIAKDLEQAGAKTLMWSLDRSLRYVPVAALHDGQSYLVERYRNVIFTPASQARLKDGVSAEWQGLGLGVSKEHLPYSALPGVAEELKGIIRDAAESQTGVLAGTIKMDEAFTAETFRTALLQQYRVVHIASHFQFRSGSHRESFLLLGDGNRLTLEEIEDLPNVFGGVELLTLSACNTATGDAEADGKEVEGFGVLAQQQGAKAVLATLWPVADRSTSEFMQKFYRQRESHQNISKAEALRRAQLALLYGNDQRAAARTSDRGPVSAKAKANAARPFNANPQAMYAHPYYWAPFILIGNWK